MEEYIVSARKYRPMTFDSVVGQSALTTTLKNAVKSGKLAHAYLFCGPRGVGKTTCARIFAKAINCEHPREDGEACNTCESCQAFNEQRSYNIFELDAASNNGVDQIKTLMEQTRIPPQVGKYKVFIIDEVHMLSAAAFNAFLKTLEEPPSHVIFILATTEKHKILPTILSRCQIYDFERMTVPNTIAHLKMVAEKEGIQYEEQALAVIAEKADGGMRDALSIFDQAASFCQGDITYQKVIEDLNVLDSDNYFKLVDLALENKVSQMMLLLDNILGKGFDGGNMIQGLAQHVRNVMMAKDTQTLPLLETSEEQKAKYVEQAKKAPTPFLYKALQLMNNCDVQYRQSSNKRLLVELTLIQIGQITQPEDQDVPSAGRTPHRLKSLFQKIVAQLKPASQGAGAGQESGSKAPITGAQPVAAATAAPISTVRKGSQVKLKGIGMSFANLEKTEQNSQRIYNPIDQLKEETPASTGAAANHDQPFTQEQVEGQWISMCLRMQGIKDFIGLANRMKPIVPTITDFPHIEVVIDNKLLLDDVVKIKGRILQTFRIGLNNSQVTLDYRLAESDEVTRILSKREILENMIKENPAIGKLTQDLRLVMA
ncbi:DNA polymerase III subunit gamma/tau [Prevotella copri]|uniref:DNA polymerase III subunit gamma/tau n=1 Tax=Segatella copri TaxID=165179 RepID=A0AAW5IK08_9BACT|nr:DNA polymerase III subunit gamma/tau [Segatella copri]MCP9534606.1 DNA polymerase III subunit gamma/tau [Segatella copri]MCP9537534.1 DNA polymerase III subunit gamma/tau [Segatella copri]MCP9540531.1 DNA polymerase III subunit gamma/tau [Segatella copri]MCP9558672.1 DNA polymerase III subunit gamma/tau [Segatella copri]MCP9561789.1 DNA polymerase III subunit gamma/tau [Segatella copri]